MLTSGFYFCSCVKFLFLHLLMLSFSGFDFLTFLLTFSVISYCCIFFVTNVFESYWVLCVYCCLLCSPILTFWLPDIIFALISDFDFLVTRYYSLLFYLLLHFFVINVFESYWVLCVYCCLL
ncbi:hypothetical protein Hdeb2414_s0005g00172491 [Helianthus debilis subsp. tardiflorus]